MRDSSTRFPLLLLLICFLPLFYSCKSKEEKEESLAKSYCGSCHLYPDPSLLDKKTWETSVLPMMSFHMGFSEPEIMAKIPDEDLMIILRALPRRPMVKDDEWSMIKNYYLNHAPDSLAVVQETIADTIAQFHIRPIQLLPEQLITLIKIDTSSQLVYLGERLSRLYKLNSHLTMVDTAFLPSPPSWISTDDKTELVTTMGIMDPNDQALGQLISLDDLSHPILDSLKRPVYFERADFNEDKAIDYVVCSFGNFTGDLSVFEATESGFRKHVVNPLPGARKTIVRDFTNDNKPDILALTAQGDEQIVLFVNNGAFQFRKKVLLRFPPVYGTSYFEIADFNNDGFFDLLIANGDNADYSRIVKPYHGIRIFENDGNDNFNEVWFYPMPGATMAMTKDFDQDGDLDIVGLSFFPDFKTAPEKSLIYFQRENGDYRFTPQVTKFANRSRWLVMETGDYDGDGDCDIIVGALNLKGSGASQVDYENWVQNKTTLLVLVNKLVDK